MPMAIANKKMEWAWNFIGPQANCGILANFCNKKKKIFIGHKNERSRGEGEWMPQNLEQDGLLFISGKERDFIGQKTHDMP